MLTGDHNQDDTGDKRLHHSSSSSLQMQIDLQHLCLAQLFSCRQLRVSPHYTSLSLSLSLSISPLPPVSEPSVPDSLCTICCVHKRFAGSRLSTAEQQGDWSSQSGNRERSPVSEKCKYSAIQRPQPQRDRDENNSHCTETTEDREGRGRLWMRERGRRTQLLKSWAKIN